MHKTLLTASILALSVAVAPACATKKFVRGEVGNVNSKVDSLGSTVEQTQQRVGQTEQRIGAVDQKAEAAGRSATEARGAAQQAQNSADAAAASARAVGTRVDEVAADVAANRKLVYEVTLSEDQGNFKFGKFDLPDTAKSRLDEVISQLKTDQKNIFIEIEGHTDNVGTKNLNERLGMERAEAVKRYLYEQHQIPLHKMNVISYGEDKPVAPNKTRDGRAQNRRVVVKVLS
jgi:outer membrane protein OmpA-like peptidoglycan-associated protein